MKLSRSPMTSLATCSRWLIVIFSGISFINGMVVAALGLYFLLNQNDVSLIMGHVFMTLVAATLVSGGILMIVCALVGLIGAAILSRGFLLGFISLLSLICLLVLGGAIMALVFKTQINEEVRASMSKSLRDYGSPQKVTITKAWDRTQQQHYCCAVDEQSWPEYRLTEWYRMTPGNPDDFTKPFVPESCCLRNQYGEFIDKNKCQFSYDGPPGVKNGVLNEALHYQGCLTAARRHGNEYFGYAIGIGFEALVVEILNLTFASTLVGQLRK